jgi:hypothetical protein
MMLTEPGREYRPGLVTLMTESSPGTGWCVHCIHHLQLLDDSSEGIAPMICVIFGRTHGCVHTVLRVESTN